MKSSARLTRFFSVTDYRKLIRYGSEYQRLTTPVAFAVCVAIASINAGDKQSYGSNFNSLSLALIALMSAGLAPDSMIEDTNAANPRRCPTFVRR